MEDTLRSYLSNLWELGGGERHGAVVDKKVVVEDLEQLCLRELNLDEEVAMGAALVFHPQDGVLAFVDSTRKVDPTKKARQAVFEFVAKFISSVLKARVKPYINSIQEHCWRSIKLETAQEVRAAAFAPIHELLELHSAGEIHCVLPDNWIPLLQRIFEIKSKDTTSTVIARVLQTLGMLMEISPERFQLAAFSDGDAKHSVTPRWLLGKCRETLSKEKNRSQGVLISGALEGLCCALSQADSATLHAENLEYAFNLVKDLMEQGQDLKRYSALKAGLKLFACHSEHFKKSFVRSTHELMTLFNKLSTNKTEGGGKGSNSARILLDAVEPAMDAFFITVANELSDPATLSLTEHEARQTFINVFSELLNTLNAKESRAKQVNMAIAALGKLAPSVARFSKIKDLQDLVWRLAHVPVPEIQNDATQTVAMERQTVFIGACADIIALLPDIEDGITERICDTIQDIFWNYHAVWTKQRKQARIQLARLFAALHTKLMLPTVLGRVMRSAMIATLRLATPGMLHSLSAMQRGLLSAAYRQLASESHLWPHFLDLWIELLTDKPTSRTVLHDLPTNDEKTVSCVLYDHFLQEVVDILHTLNLRTKTKDRVEEDPGQTSGEGFVVESTLSDAYETIQGNEQAEEAVLACEFGAELEPVEPQDMLVFLSLVPFLQVVIAETDAVRFKAWLPLMAEHIIDLSTDHPELSGFYKLFGLLLSTGARAGVFSGDQSDEGVPPQTREMVTSFIQEVVSVSEYRKDELLAACLEMALASPPGMMPLVDIAPVIRGALQLGLRHPPLAAQAMDYIEKWLELLNGTPAAASEEDTYALKKYMDPALPTLVVCLKPYLELVQGPLLEAADDAADAPAESADVKVLTSHARRLTAALRDREIRQSELEATGLEEAAVRAYQLLGRAGGAAHAILDDPAPTDALSSGEVDAVSGADAQWDNQKRLKLTLPIHGSEGKVCIWLDSLLPQVATLALTAGDRSTKVAACELVHGCVLWMLGRNARAPLKAALRRDEINQEPTQFNQLYRRLFPVVLRLAVDAEPVARQLFEPLSAQLVHWLTRNQHRENAETMALLDAVLDGLCATEGGALQDLCAGLTAEFLTWSLRHAPPEKAAGGSKISSLRLLNADSLLRRLYSLLAHPEPAKRLGGARALVRLAAVLRTSPATVSKHLLEALRRALLSLRHAPLDPPGCRAAAAAALAVRALSTLVAHRSHMFHAPAAGRVGLFDSAPPLVAWVFEQTGRPERALRVAAIKAFPALCAALPGAPSPSQWLAHHPTLAQLPLPLPAKLQRMPAPPGATGGSTAAEEGGVAAWVAWLRAAEMLLEWSTWALQVGLLDCHQLLDPAAARAAALAPSGAHPVNVLAAFLARWDTPSAAAAAATTPQQRRARDEATSRSALRSMLFMVQLLEGARRAEGGGGVAAAAAARLDGGSLATERLGQLGAAAEGLVPEGAMEALGRLVAAAVVRPQGLGAAERLDRGVGGAPVLRRAAVRLLQLALLPAVPSFVATATAAAAPAPPAQKGAQSRARFASAVQAALAAERASLSDVDLRLLSLAGGAAAHQPPSQLTAFEAQNLVAGYVALTTAGLLPALLTPPAAAATVATLTDNVCRLGADCTPRQRQLGAQMLQLAISLRLSPEQLTAMVLDAAPAFSGGRGRDAAAAAALSSGEALLNHFEAEIVPFASFNIAAMAPALFQAMAAGERRARAAYRLTARVLDRAARLGPADPRAGAVRDACLAELAALRPLAAPWVSAEAPGASTDQKRLFLGVMRRLLLLGLQQTGAAPTRATPAPAAPPWLLEAYVDLLVTGEAEVQQQALALLGAVLRVAAEAEAVSAVVAAVRRTVAALPTCGALGLIKHSPEHTRYRRTRTALLQAAAEAAAAASAAAAAGLLQALFPLLTLDADDRELQREMATVTARLWRRGAAPDSDAAHAAGEAVVELAWSTLQPAGGAPSCSSPVRQRTVLALVLAPALRSAPAAARSKFFRRRAAALVEMAAGGGGAADVSREAAFRLLQLMYDTEDKETVGEHLAGCGKNAAVARAAAAAIQAEAAGTRHAAFSCNVALLIRTQTQVKQFVKLLRDVAPHWATLLLTDRAAARNDSHVASVTSVMGAAQRVVALRRRAAAAAAAAAGPATASAQSSTLYLTSASLATDAMAAKAPEEPPPPEAEAEAEAGAGQAASSDEEFASTGDDYDRNPCMQSLVKLLNHVVRTFPPGEEEADMPEWMAPLHATVASSSTPAYTRAFVAKAVLHVNARQLEEAEAVAELEALAAAGGHAPGEAPQEAAAAAAKTAAARRFGGGSEEGAKRLVFGRHALSWAEPLTAVGALTQPSEGSATLHPFMRDVAVTLLYWPALFAEWPAAEAARLRRWAGALLHHLFEGCYAPTPSGLQANVRLVKLFLEGWGARVPAGCAPLGALLTSKPDRGGGGGGGADEWKQRRVTAVHLLGAVLLAGLPLGECAAERQALMTFVVKHAMPQPDGALRAKALFRAAAEVLGMVLRQQADGAWEAAEAGGWEERLHETLTTLASSGVKDQFLYCLERLVDRHPALLATPQGAAYTEHVLAILPSVHGEMRCHALDVLRGASACTPGLASALSGQLPALLAHRDDAAQLRTLRLLAALLAGGGDADAAVAAAASGPAPCPEPLVCSLLSPLEAAFARHPSAPCRAEYYRLLREVVARFPTLEAEAAVRVPLVGALQDPAAEVRQEMERFWDARLQGGTLQARLLAIIAQTYAPAVEHEWVASAAGLALMLADSDPQELHRLLFEDDLMECEFVEQRIDTAWAGPTLPLTPMFSQLAASQGAPAGDSATMSQAASQAWRPGMVRATQAPTQGSGTVAALDEALARDPTEEATQEMLPAWARATGASSQSALYAADATGTSRGRAERRRELVGTDRGGDRGGGSRGPALPPGAALRGGLSAEEAQRHQMKRNALRRKQSEKEQAKARHNRVALLRAYRVGELPDVKITAAALLLPLRLLLARDAAVARTLLAELCVAAVGAGGAAGVVEEDLPTAATTTKRRARESASDADAAAAGGGPVRALRAAVRGLLEGPAEAPTFVACLQSVWRSVLERDAGGSLGPEAEAAPAPVGEAALASGNLASGVLLLEEQLIRAQRRGAAPRAAAARHGGGGGAKRLRRSDGAAQSVGAAPPPEAAAAATEAWHQLALLYRELGEADVVLSVHERFFSAAKGTLDAVEAQLAGDTDLALMHYSDLLEEEEGGGGAADAGAAAAGPVERANWRREQLTCLARLGQWGLTAAGDGDDDGGPGVLGVVRQRLAAHRHAAAAPGGDGTAAMEVDLTPTARVALLVEDATLRRELLPWFVQAAVRCPGAERAALVAWSLQSDPRGARRAVEAHLGSALALAACMCAERHFDRARALVARCYREVRARWVTLPRHAEARRRELLATLQPLAEMGEFLRAAQREGDADALRLVGGGGSGRREERRRSVSAALPCGIREWPRRWPSVTRDLPEAWERLVSVRVALLDTLRAAAAAASSAPARPGEAAAGGRGSALSALTRAVYATAGVGLRKTGELTLARAYLQELWQQAGGAERPPAAVGFGHVKAVVKLRLAWAGLPHNTADDVAVAADGLRTALQYLGDKRAAAAAVAAGGWGEAEQQGSWVLEGRLCTRLTRLCASLPSGDGVGDAQAAVERAATAFQQALAPAAGGKAALHMAMFCEAVLQASSSSSSSSSSASAAASQTEDTTEANSASDDLPPAPARHAAAALGGREVVATAVVSHTLAALARGGSAAVTRTAALHVPRLLMLLGEFPEAAGGAWAAGAPRVPAWVLLPWAAQMLSLVELPEGEALLPTLATLAAAYPQPLFFPLELSAAEFGAAGRARTAALRRAVCNDALTALGAAVNDLTFPEQRFKAWAEQIRRSLKAGDRQAAAADFGALVSDCFDADAMRRRRSGEYNLAFAETYKGKVDELKKCVTKGDLGGFEKAWRGMQAQIEKNNTKSMMVPTRQAEEFSKWFASFGTDGDDAAMLEVPGQYTGMAAPCIGASVHVAGFGAEVTVLASLMRPKILTLQGDNGAEYRFVAKGGEDLRKDERIQTLFRLMGRLLAADAHCAARGLRLRTYHVLPMSTRVGLMQFVPHTETLESLAYEQMPQGATNAPFETHNKFIKNGRQTAGAASPENYIEVLGSVKREAAVVHLEAVHALLPAGALRRALLVRAHEAERFLALRRNFAATLAVFSVAGYVAGVGDRHLKNFLVDCRTGDLVGIDFGYSFGTATQLLPVPELMPFRLTRQLCGVLEPLDASAMLKVDMVRTMRVLHAHRMVLHGVMDVFLREPLLDWRQEVMTASTRLGQASQRGGTAPQPEEAASALAEASPLLEQQSLSRLAGGVTQAEGQHIQLKVGIAQRKLALCNPAAVTLLELESRHKGQKHYDGLARVVKGTEGGARRGKLVDAGHDVCQSVEEQIDCLLEQATDPNILARTWGGWVPWV